MRNIIKLALMCVLAIFYTRGYAQVAINNDGSNPEPSAQLDVASTTRGFLPPRMTTTERNAISSPAAGLLVYDITDLQHYYYDGTAWKKVNEPEGTWIKSGNSIYNLDGTIGIGLQNNGPRRLYINSNNLSTGNDWKDMVRFNLNAKPTANNSANYYAFDVELDYNSDFNNTASAYGNAAAYFACYHSGTGTINKLSAIETLSWNLSSGTITYLNGIFSGIETGGGSVTHGACFRAKAPWTSSTTNTYGIYIEPQKVTSSTGWGVYSAGTSDYNYFAGSLGLGIASPNYKLDISGDINFSGAIKKDGLNLIATTGVQSIMIGTSAGNSATGGAFNTFVGYEAGYLTTSGGVNTFIGHLAGRSNTGGGYNVFIGGGAAKNTTSATYNVVIGSNSGEFVQGQHNVFIGDFAGRSNTGQKNTFIGHNAGGGTGAISGNVFLGDNAGATATSDNRLYIENTANADPLIYGEFDNDLVKINGKIGANITPVRTLHVKDVMRIEPTASAPASPSEGDIYMDSTTHKLMVYDGTQWQACW